MQFCSLIKAAWTVFRKDLRCEFRTPLNFSILMIFAVTVLMVVSFAVGGIALDPTLLAALLWVMLFFTAMTGVARAYVQEEETGTALVLRLATDSAAIYIGKVLYSFVLLVGVAIVVVPLYLVLFSVAPAMPLALAATVVLGCLGIAVTGTTFSAIVAQVTAQGSLMTVLSFPVMLPLLWIAISTTSTAFAGSNLVALAPDLAFMFFYSGMTFVASLVLVEYL
ncbi:MAG: heme exporter protein CcmB [Peptococcaceae bacterium]|nr:heme exporter protein CcmB [Peptococcaceae bacterium]